MKKKIPFEAALPLRAPPLRRGLCGKAAADKKAKEKKAAQEAADKAARSEARRQITLILRNGGTVPNDLWEQSGYSAVTIAAMLRGRKG